MTLLRIVLFLGCVALATCQLYCSWSKCKPELFDDIEVCNAYGYKHFSGDTKGGNCAEDELKRFCCNDNPPPEVCTFTMKCYDPSQSGSRACKGEYGGRFNAVEALNCTFFPGVKYNCCSGYKSRLGQLKK